MIPPCVCEDYQKEHLPHCLDITLVWQPSGFESSASASLRQRGHAYAQEI